MKKNYLLFLFLVLNVGFLKAYDSQATVGNIKYYLTRGSNTAEVARLTDIGKTMDSIEIPRYIKVSDKTYTVKSIAEQAFYGDSALTTITLPNTLVSIKDQAFYNCFNLSSITIPSSVTSIGYDVFDYCRNLTTIIVENGNSKYDSRNNCNAIIETQYNSIRYGCCNTTFPNTVSKIGGGSFMGSGLTQINIPNSVESIGDAAFLNCTNLEKVYISNSVTSIGNSAFSGCQSLKTIRLPHNITYIADGLFENCSNLVSVYIPEKVTSIREHAFLGCSSLSSITIPRSVRFLSVGVFVNCSSLDTITCYATTPPETSTQYNNTFNGMNGTFASLDCSRILLYVRKSVMVDYKAEEQWKPFMIRPIEGYTVTFKNWDKQTLLTVSGIEYGTLPEYTGDIPTRPDDDNYTYTFKGWYPEIVEVTNDATYIAQYDKKNKHEGINDLRVNEQVPFKLLRNGQILILRGDKTYTVTGQEVK